MAATTKRPFLRGRIGILFRNPTVRRRRVRYKWQRSSATTKIGLANLAYNMQRLAWLDRRTAPA
jgi:hypothetical protein